jgi:hypothetical protein
LKIIDLASLILLDPVELRLAWILPNISLNDVYDIISPWGRKHATLSSPFLCALILLHAIAKYVIITESIQLIYSLKTKVCHPLGEKNYEQDRCVRLINLDLYCRRSFGTGGAETVE